MLTYSFEGRGESSLYEYLYRCIAHDIETGCIAPGEKLPSKRSFARHLGVSLITVEGAYTQLAAEGYISSVERKGYFACDLALRQIRTASPRHSSTPSASLQGSPSRIASSSRSAAESERSSAGLIADFTGKAVPMGLFPYGGWAKSVRAALAEESERSLIGESTAFGSLRLREVLARYLRDFRGMVVDADRIVIGAGSQILDNMIVQLLGREVTFAVEDPGYPRLTRIYRANDVPLAHIPLDGEGVRMDVLRESGADVLHLMPSHHFPTGRVTSVSRRYELMAWASEKPTRYLIEDDYDCEFRLAGRPIPSLQSIDASERVIYINTFAKSLSPAFRIGYMVLPEHLATRFRDTLGFYSSTVSAIDQLALARFIENGDYERHVNRMRTHYRNVRNEFIAALKASSLSDRLTIEAQDSGINFPLAIEGISDDVAFARAARRRGIALAPFSSFRLAGIGEEEECSARFLMDYTGLDVALIPDTVHVLEEVTASFDGGHSDARFC